MGRRYKKKKQKNKNKSTALVAEVKQIEKIVLTHDEKQKVTKSQKNDTIKELDFFGFAPELFIQDLKKTALTTLVIIIILIVVKAIR